MVGQNSIRQYDRKIEFMQKEFGKTKDQVINSEEIYVDCLRRFMGLNKWGWASAAINFHRKQKGLEPFEKRKLEPKYGKILSRGEQERLWKAKQERLKDEQEESSSEESSSEESSSDSSDGQEQPKEYKKSPLAEETKGLLFPKKLKEMTRVEDYFFDADGSWQNNPNSEEYWKHGIAEIEGETQGHSQAIKCVNLLAKWANRHLHDLGRAYVQPIWYTIGRLYVIADLPWEMINRVNHVTSIKCIQHCFDGMPEEPDNHLILAFKYLRDLDEIQQKAGYKHIEKIIDFLMDMLESSKNKQSREQYFKDFEKRFRSARGGTPGASNDPKSFLDFPLTTIQNITE